MNTYLLEIINDFIKGLERYMSRTIAVQTTKRTIANRVKKDGVLFIEYGGESLEFTKSQVKEIWNSIK